jgi:acetyl-CoA synthetase
MKPGSCGSTFLAADLDVVDDEGKPVGVNVSGNLTIRSPFPMMLRTLWRELERYLHSYFYFWVTGRVDDILNVAGHRLSTMEMESAIMECSGVAEVAVHRAARSCGGC